MLSVRDIRRAYGGVPVLQGVSCDVAAGELVGLMGANGAGKSTLLRIVAGILMPDQGSVLVHDIPVGEYPSKERAKVLAYLPQQLDVPMPLRVGELIGFTGHEDTGTILGMVGLAAKERSFLGELSGGERRRAFIALTLAQGARLLLLDEPLANLDLRYRLELLTLIDRLRKELGITVVMALHGITQVKRFDRLLVMNNGRLVEGGPSLLADRDFLAGVYGLAPEHATELAALVAYSLGQATGSGEDP